MMVLLVENSKLYQLFLSDLFMRLGYQPVNVTSHQEALHALEKYEFRLICLNPSVDGEDTMELIPQVRKLAPQASIILLTSDRAKGIRLQAVKAGVTEVIYKSSTSHIIRRLRVLLGGSYNNQVLSSSCRVLYVEDSRTQAAIVHHTLEQDMNLRVEHCDSAETALEWLVSREYDLVITDVLLKGGASGLWLLRQLRQLDNENAQLPVLTLTGHDDPERRLELLRAGTTDYVTKPVLKEELSIRVNNLLSSKLLMDKVLEQQAQMQKLAMRDELTGCYNRLGLEELAEKYICQAARQGHPISLAMVDIDHFKLINDEHGHDTGDKVLRALGKLLRRKSRKSDVVARWGGEEFVLLLPETNQTQGQAALQKLRKMVAEMRAIAGVTVTASFGFTSIKSPQCPQLNTMITCADKALYQAKRQGRNCVIYRKCEHRNPDRKQAGLPSKQIPDSRS
ncbi:signal transduction response regulator [Thiolapillus brandeum]|uniref:diguanylate cyclase n=2 Tax=Thiolapillus brandeum TaxID=1076588 RepID=A0A7U6GGT0_9GAMM|nr:signal transduction response regulator [Thiolapillus brandeum]